MKDDTVSRAAVMESLTKEYNRRRTGDGLKLAWIEKAVNELPAVQTCDDAVSRQQAITILDARLCVHGGAYGKGLSAARELIADLPAVQPQRKTDEWCSDCKEYDQERHCCPRWNRVIRQTLSEQTEIIRCKDCKHSRFFDPCLCCYEFGGEIIVPENGFCFMAERRTDG